jgi:hypothetical protein
MEKKAFSQNKSIGEMRFSPSAVSKYSLSVSTKLSKLDSKVPRPRNYLRENVKSLSNFYRSISQRIVQNASNVGIFTWKEKANKKWAFIWFQTTFIPAEVRSLNDETKELSDTNESLKLFVVKRIKKECVMVVILIGRRFPSMCLKGRISTLFSILAVVGWAAYHSVSFEDQEIRVSVAIAYLLRRISC